MLGDGLWPGASTLVVGPTGVGKTLIGLHFLFHGAKSGQPGIHATFQENATQLRRIVIDSLPDVMTAAGDPTRFREWMFSMVQRCTRQGISLLMTLEVPELYDIRY